MTKTKTMLSLLLVVSMLLGLFCFFNPAADNLPEVDPAVEAFVSKLFYLKARTDTVEQCTIAGVEKIHGPVAAAQYANLMNYYYDTLDAGAYLVAERSFLSPEKEYSMPGGPNDEEVFVTICWTTLEENREEVAETRPYLFEYTPISPRPDYSWVDLDALTSHDRSYFKQYVAEHKPEGVPGPVDLTETPTTASVSPAPVASATPAPSSTPSSTPTAASAQPFPDVAPDAWYYKAVSAMKNSGIIMGCDDGLFHPERTIKQGEFYAMLLRAGTFSGANISGGLTYQYPRADAESIQFNNHWATGTMMVAYRLHLCPATSGEHIDPLGQYNFLSPKYYYSEWNVDRTEAVTRIVALLNKKKAIDASTMALAGPMTFAAIPDHDAIDRHIASMEQRDFAGRFTGGEGTQDTIAYAYNIGVCQGVDAQGTFDPDKLLTRAEIAQLFYNAGFTYRQNFLPTSRAIGAYDFNSTENVIY